MDKASPGRTVSRLIATLFVLGAAAYSAASEGGEAERLVFQLQHVNHEYGRAVEDGRVVNAPEYDEVVALVAATRARFVPAQAGGDGAKIAAGLTGLETGIRQKEPPERVSARIAELVALVSRDGGGLPSPAGKGDPVRGRELYQRDCAACHGKRATGDGFAAPGMIPSPGSLADPALVRTFSPQHLWGAIRFGIQGTAMPSYEEAYPGGEAWDLTAFVDSLQEGENPEPDTATDLDVARRLERTFTQLAERVVPAVVGISLFRRQTEPASKTEGAARGPGWQQDGLDDLYSGYRRVRSRSGVLASEDGYILTCGHLFDPEDAPPADTILDVETNGGQHFRAWVVGIEPTVDFAVLKVEAPIGLKPATLGDSDSVRTGRFAVALGDPPGPELTFAVGTISAKAAQECYQDDRTSTLLQWSARIGPESFGGPLVDLDGRVIGITVPPHTDMLNTGRDESPAFALPIKLARTLFEALKAKQSTRSPWLGFAVRALDWERRSAMKAPQFGGIEIVNVFDPSPASRAGIRVGDILMQLDGNRVNAVHDFQYWLYLSGIDKTVSLTLFRDGASIERRAKIEVRPASAVPR